MHTDGNLSVTLDDAWDDVQVPRFEAMGYEVRRGSSAKVTAAGVDPDTGSLIWAER